MTYRVLHLSDTHVGAAGSDAEGVDAVASLEQMLSDCRRLPPLNLVLVTGDVSDDGSAAGCGLVRERIGSVAQAHGIPHIYTTGNHDRREGFRRALGSGHLGPDGADVGRLMHAGAIAAVSMVDGMRIITLDSLVEGSVHGLISAGQLDALRVELGTKAPRGTVLAFHHPPIGASCAPWTREIGLRNADALAAVVAGSDVRAVLCGHLHLQMTGSFAQTTVWVTPGIVSRFDLTAPADRLRAVRGACASVVEFEDRLPPTCYLLHSRDRTAGKQILVVDPVSWQPATEELNP